MYQRYFKRIFDMLLSVIMLVLLSPVMVIVAIAIKATSKGPVLFVQERTGMGGKTFNMYKFRTMSHGNDVMDASSENVMTFLGKILRKLSIDELPQLVNVLLGDMSLIGPRPWIPEYHKHMTPMQRKRSEVRPGITGMAQAFGRNNLTIHKKLKYDVTYVNNVTFKTDLSILLQTAKSLFDTSVEAISKSSIHDEINALKKSSLELQNSIISSESSNNEKQEVLGEQA